MASHNEIGKHGERLAAQFFEEKGFRVLEKNYRHKKAEIDLIVEKENLIVFVEVKTRKNADFGNPEEFVSKAQQYRILRVSEIFQEQRKGSYNIRFDIVSIIGTPPRTTLEHFEDAF